MQDAAAEHKADITTAKHVQGENSSNTLSAWQTLPHRQLVALRTGSWQMWRCCRLKMLTESALGLGKAEAYLREDLAKLLRYGGEHST